jgi:hypothetical protein
MTYDEKIEELNRIKAQAETDWNAEEMDIARGRIKEENELRSEAILKVKKFMELEGKYWLEVKPEDRWLLDFGVAKEGKNENSYYEFDIIINYLKAEWNISEEDLK